MKSAGAWLLIASLLVSPLAYARPKQESADMEARKDCLSGKLDEGITILAERFAQTRDPTYVFNQARCFEQNNRPEDALNRFEEYLRIQKNISPADKAEVDQHMADCRAKLSAQSAPPPFPATAPIGSPSVGPSASPAAFDLSAQPATRSAGGQEEHRPFFKTWWFWTGTAAVVVAGTVTAILLARQSNDRCDGATLTCQGVK